MNFQNITMAKPSHLYLVVKPYLDPATTSKILRSMKPSVIGSSYSMENPQQQALHTQWITYLSSLLQNPIKKITCKVEKQ